LRASGTNSVAEDNLVLSVTGMRSNQFGLLFMGQGTHSGLPFGAGIRCVQGQLFRFQPRNSGSGGSFAYGPGLVATSRTRFAAAGWILSGATWNFQAWYRDPMGPCARGSNASNALGVEFLP
jgi:hypothetical protein